MKKTTIYLINTDTKDKVWIGRNEFFSSICVGIQFTDGRIWDGEKIFRDNLSHDAYINKVWQIATLMSKVWRSISSVQGNFALDACVSALKENKLPYEEEKVEKLAEYVLHLGPKIREAMETPMPQEYIDSCQSAMKKDDNIVDTLS